MTKWELFSALGQYGTRSTTLTARDGSFLAVGVIQSVERESGSGSSFNVRIVDTATNDARNVYIITRD